MVDQRALRDTESRTMKSNMELFMMANSGVVSDATIERHQHTSTKGALAREVGDENAKPGVPGKTGIARVTR